MTSSNVARFRVAADRRVALPNSLPSPQTFSLAGMQRSGELALSEADGNPQLLFYFVSKLSQLPIRRTTDLVTAITEAKHSHIPCGPRGTLGLPDPLWRRFIAVRNKQSV